MIVISLIFILAFMAAATILILAERHFIQKRKKWEKILPVLVTVLAVYMIFANAIGNNSVSGACITDTAVIENEQSVGDIFLLKDRDKHLISIGQLRIGDGEEREYINVKFEDGKVTGPREALPYKEDLEATVGYFGKYTGAAKTYGELLDQNEALQNEKKYTFDMGNFVFGIICYGITPIVLWAMLLLHKGQMKKKNLLEKTRLEDL